MKRPASNHPAVAGKIGARLPKPSTPPHGANKPGGRGSYDVDDEVFFTRQSGGPSSGRVVSHGQHGCTIDEACGQRHQVRWDSVLGLKGRKTFPARVVEKGLSGSILEREDGSRFFTSGDVPVAEEPDALSFDDPEDAAVMAKSDALARLEEMRTLIRAADRPTLRPAGVPILWNFDVC